MTLRDRLAAGTTNYLGCANQVVREALHNHALVRELIDALDDDRPTVQHRAANALRKIQHANPALLERTPSASSSARWPSTTCIRAGI